MTDLDNIYQTAIAYGFTAYVDRMAECVYVFVPPGADTMAFDDDNDIPCECRTLADLQDVLA